MSEFQAANLIIQALSEEHDFEKVNEQTWWVDENIKRYELRNEEGYSAYLQLDLDEGVPRLMLKHPFVFKQVEEIPSEEELENMEKVFGKDYVREFGDDEISYAVEAEFEGVSFERIGGLAVEIADAVKTAYETESYLRNCLS